MAGRTKAAVLAAVCVVLLAAFPTIGAPWDSPASSSLAPCKWSLTLAPLMPRSFASLRPEAGGGCKSNDCSCKSGGQYYTCSTDILNYPSYSCHSTQEQAWPPGATRSSPCGANIRPITGCIAREQPQIARRVLTLPAAPAGPAAQHAAPAPTPPPNQAAARTAQPAPGPTPAPVAANVRSDADMRFCRGHARSTARPLP